ncbi:MAG TPA: 5-(carboxyamino)imidazole ribonucleotide synthase [Pirellulales bacterium]|nr:5-(carboxyamino)imidazole ribonucleotide synthase [Pirellulales bacterium]
MNRAILPGATVGVLGSGQLGRMFAIAARRMGYRVHTLSPEDDTPTGQVADLEINAGYDDLDAVRRFARQVSVVTFEFENVPAATAAAAAECALVRPAGSVLHTTQHRLREKTFLRSNGFPVAPFAAVRSAAELDRAARQIGLPAVLKTAGWGYDGKGQIKLTQLAEVNGAFSRLATDEAVLEAWVDFECEASVVAARGHDGSLVDYGLIANTHQNHILDVSLAPAPLPQRIVTEAVTMAHAVLEKLEVVGVLCVEFFITTDGSLVINELAPRPHNSGHLTFDAAVTSQFEQQLRAICGLPLGSPRLMCPAAMANILGDIWQEGEPDWRALCACPNVKLHLYGKAAPRPGRKMGHLTALANEPAAALRDVLAAREALRGASRPQPTATQEATTRHSPR